MIDARTEETGRFQAEEVCEFGDEEGEEGIAEEEGDESPFKEGVDEKDGDFRCVVFV